MLQESQEREQIIERVAALDIGKAELVCCVRVPSPTVAYTDSTGHASSSVTVPSSAQGLLLRVAAQTQAGGFYRNSSSTFTAK